MLLQTYPYDIPYKLTEMQRILWPVGYRVRIRNTIYTGIIKDHAVPYDLLIRNEQTGNTNTYDLDEVEMIGAVDESKP